MTRTVGTRERNEFVLDPTEAWRRGRALDRMLPLTTPLVARGATHAQHAFFNAVDDQRQLERAKLLNR